MQTWISYKYILQTLEQPLKKSKKSIAGILRKDKKCNHIKCSKPQKAEKE